MATTPEGKVKNIITAYLKSLPNCWYFMPIGGPFSTAGVPDYIGCYRGHFFAIEAKKPGGKPTALQVMQMAGIEKAWGWVGVVSDEASLAKFKEWVELVR